MEQLVTLSWIILELKFAYYHPAKLHSSWADLVVPDSVYDAIEDQYKKLCSVHGATPTASDMVGFDFRRPSCVMVAGRLSEPRDGDSVYTNFLKESASGRRTKRGS